MLWPVIREVSMAAEYEPVTEGYNAERANSDPETHALLTILEVLRRHIGSRAATDRVLAYVSARSAANWDYMEDAGE
jgi:hypothetical protein